MSKRKASAVNNSEYVPVLPVKRALRFGETNPNIPGQAFDADPTLPHLPLRRRESSDDSSGSDTDATIPYDDYESDDEQEGGGRSDKDKKVLAERAYKLYLPVAERLVGNRVTTSTELNNACQSLFGKAFQGVFPSDRIPRLVRHECAIANVDKSTQSGSHWIAMTPALVYDSFGRTNNKLIPHASLKQHDTELDAEQTDDETNCGARCIAFLIVWGLHGTDVAKYI
jgi:hypothetical protein